MGRVLFGLTLVLCLAANPATRPIEHFVPSTPEQDAKANEQARKVAAEVETFLETDFTEISTEHFLIFTDWDKPEQRFLKDNCEAAYRTVAKQFNLKGSDKVFVGKMGVFMFVTKESFLKYAREYDEYPAGEDLIGYYSLHADGSGHLAMYRPVPERNTRTPPEQEWAYVMARELTKAFVDRYRTPEQLPVWLSEGIAEVVAQSLFPSPQRRFIARILSTHDDDYQFIFEANARPIKAFDPLVHTLTQMLIDIDRKKFVELVNAIKDGEDPEAALQGLFGYDYPAVVKAWKEHMGKR